MERYERKKPDIKSSLRWKKAAVWTAVLLFWLAVWQLAYRIVGRDLLLASPFAVFRRVFELAATTDFWRIIGTSFCRIMAGFLLGVLLGTLLGIITAGCKTAYQVLKLPMSIIKATPVASFVILALIWISGKNLSTFISFLMVLPMVHQNVHQGLKSADPLLLEAARSYRLGRLKTAHAVYLPAVLPYFLSVCRVAMGFAWKAGIAGEVIAIPRDTIGTQLYNAKIYLETTDLFAWTVVIVVLSVVIERIFTWLLLKAAARWGAGA